MMVRFISTLLAGLLTLAMGAAFGNTVTEITVGAEPGVSQLSPDGSTLYVSHKCHMDGSCGGPIEVIDTQTNKLKRTIDKHATALIPAIDGKSLYAATDDEVYALQLDAHDSVKWSVDVWADFVRPVSIALAPNQQTLYVALEKITTPREIGVFDTLQGVETNAVVVPDLITDDIQVSSDGKRLYGVTYNGHAEQLLVIDTTLIGKTPDVVVKRIKLGESGMPTHALRVSPDGRTVYVSVFNGLVEGTLYTVDTTTQAIKAQPMTHAIVDMQLSSDGKMAYELTSENLNIVDLETNERLQSIALPLQHPERLTVDAAGKTAYITAFSGNKITVIDL